MLKAKDNGNKTLNCPYCDELYSKDEVETDTVVCYICQKTFIIPEFFIGG